MEKNIVEIAYTSNNFSAHVPKLPGCVSTGQTPNEIKNNIKDAIAFHIKGMQEDNDPVPASFKGNYELVYKFDTQSLLKYYKGIFTQSALERLSGINQRQLSHYSSGLKKPRPLQRKKIEDALHELGKELLAVEL